MRFLDFLLLVLLPQVSSGGSKALFRAEDGTIELGYCFGVDYIVVYRSGPQGDQLLGNSSADHTPIPPPADLKGRIRINEDKHLLGLQISGLTNLDSGTYKRECWRNRKQVSQDTQQLYVCDEEVNPEEIIQREEGEMTELWCNQTSIGVEGTTVRWFREQYPFYEMTLLLDSSVSLDPLLEGLQGVVEVRENGALLLLDSVVLKNNHHFYCMVIREKNCLSYQNMFLPDRSESKDMFSSQGDRVVLNCHAEGNNQLWETPLGKVDANSVKNELMFITFGEKSKDFSLVIPAASDEYSGDYSCISSTVEVQYSLVLCPKIGPQEKLFIEGRNVSLECNVSQERSQKVLWYRLDPSDKHELIHDSDDPMVPVPDDLIGRLILSENGSSLSIAHLEERDKGVYWCVVVGGYVFLEEEDDDYDVDYPEEGEGEGELIDEDIWQDSSSCSLKQETTLVFKRTGHPFHPILKTDPTPEPKPDSYTTLIAVGAVIGLLVLGVIVAVIVFKRRRNTSPKQSDAAACSPLKTPNVVALNMEPKVEPSSRDAMLNPE